MTPRVRTFLKNIAPLRAGVFWLRYRQRVQTYSQQGEDLLITLAFKHLRITNPTYMDIGANHPTHINNTALFYKRGSRGINIEPDPIVFKKLLGARRRDTNLNIAIGDNDGEADFYIFKHPEINTLSKNEAEERVKLGFAVQKIITIPVMTITTVVRKYCGGTFPDLLSLDAEGMDETILHSIDFNASYPKVVCVETVIFAGSRAGEQQPSIAEFLLSKGYYLFASTHINGIFCKK